MTMALEGGEGPPSRPGRSLPPGKTRYPFYRRLGGPQGRSGQVRKISPPTGIRSPDRPARSQSLYRLRYPAHKPNVVFDGICVVYSIRNMGVSSEALHSSVLCVWIKCVTSFSCIQKPSYDSHSIPFVSHS